ncbi:MAG: alpha/beta hydrolase [Clostridia bacterium]|nr:alpha/beta hydrolase [Clostridia bacterium]
MEKYFDVRAQGRQVRCKVYYKEKPQAEKAVICCTGFAGHKDNRAANGFADKLLSKRKDTVVVVFNWPAHGDDIRKKPTLADCSLYLDLVVDEVRRRFGAQELYGYATSFGGYLLLKYISEQSNPFRKIALRCPAVDMYDVLSRAIMSRDELDRIQKGKDVPVGFDRKIPVTPVFLESLKENDIRQRDFSAAAENLLILHGTADEVVPFESGQSFAAQNGIRFIPVENADHRFQNPVHMSLANKLVMQFFDLTV